MTHLGMEDGAIPPPLLTGEGEKQSYHSRHRWMLFSLISFGVWLVFWSLLIYAGATKRLNDVPDWASATLVIAALATCALPFAALLVGLLTFRTRQGKVITFVSGLHTLVVLLFAVAIFYTSQKKK